MKLIISCSCIQHFNVLSNHMITALSVCSSVLEHDWVILRSKIHTPVIH